MMRGPQCPLMVTWPPGHCPASAGQRHCAPPSTSVLACVTLPCFCRTNINLSPCLCHTALLLPDKYQPQSLPVSHCPACRTNINLSPCLCHTALLLSDKYQPQSLPASHCPASARQISASVFACVTLPCFCRRNINLSLRLCYTALLLSDKCLFSSFFLTSFLN